MVRNVPIVAAGFAAIVIAASPITSRVVGNSQGATYKGSAACRMCHTVMHKEIVTAYDATAHPRGMQKANVPGAIVGDFSTDAVFAKDQVAYVLGKGRNKQAYLDANFQVLPAVWDVKAKAWKPKQAVDGSTQCVGCHVTGYAPAAKSYAELGVGCEACHGPGSAHVAGDKNAIVNPKKLAKPRQAMVCGQCHSVGKDTSGKFAHPVGFRPGDDLTKMFVDAKPTAPGSNQQYSEYIQSKHAVIDIGCMGCHDAHNVAGMTAQLKKPVNDLCLGCHAATVKDMATHAPQARPDATCATCHMPSGQHTFAKLVR